MKKLCLICGLTCAYLFAFSQAKDIEALKKITQAWINAYPKKDTAALRKVFADDLLLVNSSGVTLKKKEIFSRIMEPNRQYISAKSDSITSVRIFGNMGVVMGKNTFVRSLSGVQSVIHNSYMVVCEKRKNNWVMVALHVTVLNPNPSDPR
ncbi:MAG: nuclear transport factor 2 family protein [Bacteroidetes bacterium]|nr:nuclear transport factor 2 family protein [Bacteroidota bacterium]